jgi:hypothetical protein
MKRFFIVASIWTLIMIVGRVITGEQIKATHVAIFALLGIVVGLLAVLIGRTSERKRDSQE